MHCEQHLNILYDKQLYLNVTLLYWNHNNTLNNNDQHHISSY